MTPTVLVALLSLSQAPDASDSPVPKDKVASETSAQQQSHLQHLNPQGAPAPTPQTQPTPTATLKDASLFVMEPKLVQLPGVLKDTISATVSQAAVNQGLSVMSRADAEEILKNQIELDQLGADANGDALAALGRAVGAKHLLATTVSSVDGDTVLHMRLIDSQKSKVLSRKEGKSSEYDGELVKAVEAITRITLAPIFAHLQGKIQVEVSEEGANVLLDGEQLGVSPIDPFMGTGGYHLLTITKEGFIRHQETIQIQGGDLIERMIKLRPSQEFLNRYRKRNQTYRRIAWSTTAATVATLASTIAFTILQKNKEDDRDAVANAFNNLPPNEQTVERQEETAAQVRKLDNDAKANRNIAAISGAGAGASLITALYFWIFGENPTRYDEFVLH